MLILNSPSFWLISFTPTVLRVCRILPDFRDRRLRINTSAATKTNAPTTPTMIAIRVDEFDEDDDVEDEDVGGVGDGEGDGEGEGEGDAEGDGDGGRGLPATTLAQLFRTQIADASISMAEAIASIVVMVATTLPSDRTILLMLPSMLPE